MKLVFLIGLCWMLAAPVQADTPPQLRAPLVADEGLEGHRAYLDGRMALGQFDAMDSLLETLSVGQREYLLHQLLSGLKSLNAPSPALLAWVERGERPTPAAVAAPALRRGRAPAHRGCFPPPMY